MAPVDSIMVTISGLAANTNRFFVVESSSLMIIVDCIVVGSMVDCMVSIGSIVVGSDGSVVVIVAMVVIVVIVVVMKKEKEDNED